MGMEVNIIVGNDKGGGQWKERKHELRTAAREKERDERAGE